MKHLPFQSIYRPNYEVVEQRAGNKRLYPHNDQLPVLLRALNLEFRNALPARLARADHRARDYDKVLLRCAALMFVATHNAARKDHLHLAALPDRNLVSRISIVQQITKQHRLGVSHRFRFYAGPDFFPEIYLNGRRVAFADHVLERFSTRVEKSDTSEALTQFLLVFFGSPMISLPVGPGRGFIVPHGKSILAFPYKESAGEYFITTCLTLNEITSLRPDIPVMAVNLHYDPAFSRPKIRNWVPFSAMLDALKAYENKTPLELPKPHKERSWHHTASMVRDMCERVGAKQGSRLNFVDGIPGPNVLEIKPGEEERHYDEMNAYRRCDPNYDWPQLLAQCYGEPWPGRDVKESSTQEAA
jgi:hypothetical protein